VRYPALNTEVRRPPPVLAIVRAPAANAIRLLTGAAVLLLVGSNEGVVAAMSRVSEADRRVDTKVQDFINRIHHVKSGSK